MQTFIYQFLHNKQAYYLQEISFSCSKAHSLLELHLALFSQLSIMDAMFAEDMADIVLTTSLLLFLFFLLERA
jgi:hypothetical protein